MGDKNRITYQRWKWEDGIIAEKYTGVSVSVFGPWGQYRHLTVLVTFANGAGKCTVRCRSVQQAQEFIVIPAHRLSQLLAAQLEAQRQVAELLQERRKLLGCQGAGG